MIFLDKNGGALINLVVTVGLVTGYIVPLIRTDANGNRLWDKTFDGYSINSFQPTTDGGYIMCGSRYPMSETLLVKLSPIQ